MFMLIAAVALIAFVSSLIYLMDFARASRRDQFFHPADRGGVKRARLVSGMYVRGGEPEGVARHAEPIVAISVK
jgi:hypothetical protein